MASSKLEVLITKKFPEDIIKPLQSVAKVYQWDKASYDLMPRDEILQVINRISAIINQAELRVDKELLERGKRLKIVANVSLGTDNLDLDLMTTYKVWATNTPGFFSHPVAEYILGGLITVYRNLFKAHQFVKNGEWNTFQPGRWDGESLANKTLGIIGMGSIGKSLARMASSLGMKVIYFSRSEKSHAYQKVSFNELLSSSDAISVNVPYSSQTHELIGPSQFERMKSGVIFINTSRGKVINENSLIHFLQVGHLGGAVLDVFAHEPFVPTSLRNMSNVLLSPHLAGGTKDGRAKCYKLAIDNVIEVMKGNPPINPLNLI